MEWAIQTFGAIQIAKVLTELLRRNGSEKIAVTEAPEESTHCNCVDSSLTSRTPLA